MIILNTISVVIYKAYTIQGTLFYFLTSTSSNYINHLYTLLSLCLTYQSLTFLYFFTLLSKILIKLILIDGYPLNFLYFHLLFTYRHTNLQFYAFFYLCPKACYFIFTIYRFKKCHSYFFNIQTLESLFSMSFMSNQETGV